MGQVSESDTRLLSITRFESDLHVIDKSHWSLIEKFGHIPMARVSLSRVDIWTGVHTSNSHAIQRTPDRNQLDNRIGAHNIVLSVLAG
jgi:hypothetical protein